MWDLIVQYLGMANEALGGGAIAKAVATMVSLGVVDILCRLLKTEKPWSVLLGLSAALKIAVKIGEAFVKVCLSADKLLDQVIPQRLKPAPVAVEAPKPEQPPSA